MPTIQWATPPESTTRGKYRWFFDELIANPGTPSDDKGWAIWPGPNHARSAHKLRNAQVKGQEGHQWEARQVDHTTYVRCLKGARR